MITFAYANIRLVAHASPAASSGATSNSGAFKQITTRRIIDFAKTGIRLSSNPYIGKLKIEDRALGIPERDFVTEEVTFQAASMSMADETP